MNLPRSTATLTRKRGMTFNQQESQDRDLIKPAITLESDVFQFTTEDSISIEDDKRILKRIDLCLLPVMALSYMFQFLDKSALAFTSILGLQESLHLSGNEYSWSSAIYYFGYLIASYPAALVLVRWKVGKTITASVAIWGSVLILTATCFNAAGLLSIRLALGIAEAPIAPALTVVVSMWYKRSEQPLRHAAWFLGNSCAGIFGALLVYGIGHIETIAAWKAVFLIFGAATLVWSVGLYFLLPDTPMDAWCLNKNDRIKAIIRVKDNMTGIKNDKIKWYQVREALMDKKMWLLIGLQLAGNIPNGGITTFSSIVTKGFGFSTFDTLLLGSLQYISQMILVIIGTAGSSYFQNARTLFMMGNYAIAIAGTAMIRYLPAHLKWARLGGTILTAGFSANFPLIMSLMSGNFGGFSKKTTVNALSFIAYCVGNIIGPQLFFQREAPSYDSGFLSILICIGCGLVLTLVLRLYLIWENRRRDSQFSTITTDGVMVNLTDKTDQEIPQFRYVY